VARVRRPNRHVVRSGLACLGLVLLGLGAAPRPAAAQIVRIGFVDSQIIFEKYRFAVEQQTRFNREIEAWRTDAEERKRAVDLLRGELKDQGPMLSDAKRLEKETALQKALSEYDAFVQAFWGPQGRAQQLNAEMTREVIGKVRDVVERIANRDGYDLVLDAADGNVIFGVRSLDLTDRVLDELNRDAGTGAAAPSP
jgi:outer membrane protein